MVYRTDSDSIRWEAMLKPLRESRRMSQSAVARALGIPPSLVSRYESGDRRPTASQALQLEVGVALGEPDDREERPGYIVCALVDGSIRIPLLENTNAYVFERRDTATIVANLLRVAGFPAYAAPSWGNHPIRAVIARAIAREGKAAKDVRVDLVTVDAASDPEQLGAALADYAYRLSLAIAIVCIESELRHRKTRSRKTSPAKPPRRGGDSGDAPT